MDLVLIRKHCGKRWKCWLQAFSVLSNYVDSSKLKEFADNSFLSNENSRKFFKQVENTVGKGEIFPQCIQSTCTADM